MREAVNAINEQGMSVSKASVLYGIPRTTLNDHKLGKVLPGAKPGAPTLLSTSEEEDLVDFLIKSGMDAQGRKYWTLYPECWHAEALTEVSLVGGGINFSFTTQSWQFKLLMTTISADFLVRRG